MAPHVLASICPLCPRSACNHLVLALYVVCVSFAHLTSQINFVVLWQGSPGWPLSHHVAKAGLQLPILLPLHPKC